jgi:hypothetical protein
MLQKKKRNVVVLSRHGCVVNWKRQTGGEEERKAVAINERPEGNIFKSIKRKDGGEMRVNGE